MTWCVGSGKQISLIFDLRTPPTHPHTPLSEMLNKLFLTLVASAASFSFKEPEMNDQCFSASLCPGDMADTDKMITLELMPHGLFESVLFF